MSKSTSLLSTLAAGITVTASLAGCGSSNGATAASTAKRAGTTKSVSVASSGSDVVTPSVFAGCAHALSRPIQPYTKQSPEVRVESKAVTGGILGQHRTAAEEATINYDLEHRIEIPKAELTSFSIYVFKNSQIAIEAFKIIVHTPNAEEEWGAGGTFQRANVVLTTQTSSPSLVAAAETLLNKCSVPGHSQSILRKPPNEAPPSKPSQTGGGTYEGEIGQRSEPSTPSETGGND